MQPFIEFDGVDHGYGAEGPLAVQDLHVSIGEGEFAAVVGPSGCGKSTFMKLTTGLQFPRAGTITVAGERVTKPVRMAGMAVRFASLSSHCSQLCIPMKRNGIRWKHSSVTATRPAAGSLQRR